MILLNNSAHVFDQGTSNDVTQSCLRCKSTLFLFKELFQQDVHCLSDLLLKCWSGFISRSSEGSREARTLWKCYSATDW